MSTIILNFSTKEVTSVNIEEAKQQITDFHVQGSADAKFRKFKEGKSVITDRDIKEFMVDYLAEKSKNAPGIGFYLTLTPAVKDTRERPYSVKKVKAEAGKRAWKKQYIAIDNVTNEVVAKVDTNATDADRAIKDAYKKGYTGNCKLNIVKEVVKGTSTIAEYSYAPSKGSQFGTYLFFGNALDK